MVMITVHSHLISTMTKDIKTHCSVSVHNIFKNSVTQVSPNYYLMALIKNSTLKHKCPGYTRNITLSYYNPSRRIFCIYSSFYHTSCESHQFKMSVALWDYYFDLFLNSYDPLIKLLSDFRFTILTQGKPNCAIGKIPSIANVPILRFINKLEVNF